MSFLDYILAGFGVYEVKEDIVKQSPKNKLESNTTLSNNFSSTKEIKKSPTFEKSSSQMAIFCPKNSAQVFEIAKFLAKNQPLLVDMSSLPKELYSRSLDFLSGAKTALDATMKKLENGLFVFVPKGTQLVGFLEEEK